MKSFNTKNLIEIKKGTNNRVFKGEYKNKEIVIKKFSNSKNSKNKNFIEFKFTKIFYKSKNSSVAKPLKISKKYNYAIYEFLKGEKIKKVTNKHIKLCAKFINEIQIKNRHLLNLPMARESCLSLKDHIKLVTNKLKKISLVKNNKKLHLFIKNKFTPSWLSFIKNFRLIYRDELNYKVKKKNLIISPSDFNFNNILLYKKKLFFFDFEYSGLDDCRKLICDFVCQPDIKINNNQKKLFIKKLNQKYIIKKNIIEDLIVLHKFKWCLILLNIYVSNKIKKKQFDKNNYSNKSQLKKSINYYNKNKLYKYGN